MFSKEEIYMQLPFDLSGACSKNRFKVEILWGLKRALELYKVSEDFDVIFDYACDIEVHKENELEFYQLKTRKRPSPFSVSNILKREKDKPSILGKLYSLENGKIDNLQLNLVSNVPLKSDKLHLETEKINLADLAPKFKNEIIEKLKIELNKSLEDEIKLDKIFYIHSTMDLANPENSLIGEIVNFYLDIKGKEPSRPKSLYNVLFQTISEKATYEFECPDYKTLITKKALSKKELTKIIEVYSEKNDLSIKKTQEFIEKNYSKFKEKILMKRSLVHILGYLEKDKSLKLVYESIKQYLTENIEKLNYETMELVEKLFIIFSDKIGYLYEEVEKKVLILYVIIKVEEDIYE